MSGRALTLTPASAAAFLCLLLPFGLALSVISPLYVFAAGFVVVFGLVLAERDFYLGAAVALTGVNALFSGSAFALSTAGWFAAGALLVVLVRTLPVDALRLAALGLVLVGLFQSGYGVAQALAWVPEWAPAPNGIEAPEIHGTMGAPRMLGAIVALTGALAPWWLLPVFVAGLYVSSSWLAAAALGVALVVRYRRHAVKAVVAGLVVALLLTAIYVAREGKTGTIGYRAEVWAAAVVDLAASDPMVWAIGYGPGSWWQRMPHIELYRRPELREIMRAAYNEPLQWVYENGLLGLALLVGWLRTWRYAFLAPSPFAPALCALAVLSLGTFPFHLAQLAGPALLVVGGATREVHG